MSVVDYDDHLLQELFEEMDPRNRAKVLKGAYRKAGASIRKKVRESFTSRWQGRQVGLQKGVRMNLYTKKAAGFRVTIGSKGKYATKESEGVHLNRWGKLKPILMWAETGSQPRSTKGGKRKAHSTGEITRYGFYSSARASLEQSATDELRNAIPDAIAKVAVKYGCRKG